MQQFRILYSHNAKHAATNQSHFMLLLMLYELNNYAGKNRLYCRGMGKACRKLNGKAEDMLRRPTRGI